MNSMQNKHRNNHYYIQHLFLQKKHKNSYAAARAWHMHCIRKLLASLKLANSSQKKTSCSQYYYYYYHSPYIRAPRTCCSKQT